jgi:hypothetical protein
MASDYIPTRDADFWEWSRFLLTYAKARMTVFGIPSEAFIELRTLQSTFESAFEIYEQPDHGKVDVLRKNEAREAYKKGLRDFNNTHLLHNPNVSNEDRREMRLPIHNDTKISPTPQPTTHTAIKIKRNQNRT